MSDVIEEMSAFAGSSTAVSSVSVSWRKTPVTLSQSVLISAGASAASSDAVNVSNCVTAAAGSLVSIELRVV
ncbi:Uncharacterised protein [Mycobacteroides abscessus]|nr:Uncharacterised protein [Mycobacteroides abscessus]